MPKITIDGKEIECRDGVPVLQAALDAGIHVPHYCYHPGLTVVASCRLCLMEVKMPHPKTKELVWAPKLFPSCQTPAKDGMEVRFQSETVKGNQKRTMEYYLINHPLDCPVCDKAGECYLQDYAEEFGSAMSRMVEEKYKTPKKDIGSHTLLYTDRCVMCTRCVRFCDEIAGEGELRVTNRGSRNEIDVFPGVPLENPLQGNVVDLCPVGALLSKDFLFKQRVWFMRTSKSVSPVDATGSTIYIDHNDDTVFRIRPRFNDKVNEWWISDEARFDWKYVHHPERLSQPQRYDGDGYKSAAWEDLPRLLHERFERAAKGNNGKSVAAVLSPMMSCEEAFLLAKFTRAVAPEATLACGFVPVEGQDQIFSKGFVIKAEKCPNRKGVETILAAFGGNTANWDEFLDQAGRGKFSAIYAYGGYPKAWITEKAAAAFKTADFVAVHDLLASDLTEQATLRLPAASWAEREGSFMNHAGLVQPFERAISPREGVKFDGQFYWELAGQTGLYRGSKARALMAEQIPALAEVFEPREEPEYAH